MIEANSILMIPAPMKVILLGRDSIDKKSQQSYVYSLPSILNLLLCCPVATTMYYAPTVSPSTSILCSSKIVPLPIMTSIP